MKNSKLFVLPLLFVTSLASCSGFDAEHSIVPMLNYDSIKFNLGGETWYETDTDRLFNLIDNKYSFVLEIYQNSCIHCQEFEVHLKDYIRNNHYQFYRLGLNTSAERENFNVLTQTFPEVFENFVGTPAVYFIDQGKLTYEVSSNKFDSYAAFAKMADKHFFPNHMYSVSTIDGLNAYLEDFSSSFIYMMDPSSIVSSEIFNLIHECKKDSDKNVLMIDYSSIDDENYAQICARLNVGITDHFAIYYNEKDSRTNVDYLVDDGKSIKEWLTSYLA